MDDLRSDLRYAIRGLLRSPGFTLVAIVTLALGIGVNSSIFSLVNAVLLRPLPVDDPEQLVDIYAHTSTSTFHDSNSYPNYLDYREQAQTLSGLVGYSNFFASLSIDGSSELVVGELVTEDYFSVLGVEPMLGRSFVPEEYSAPSAYPVAIVSHAFWQNRLGSDPGVLGRTFRLNGIPYSIVGVAPASFGGMFPAVTAQMWIPTAMVEDVEPLGSNRNSGPLVGETRLEQRGRHWMWLRGRMRPDVEIEEVRAELSGVVARLAEQYPETNERERITVLATSGVAINPDFDRTLAPAGFLLLGAVGLVLLVACANLANMLLARAATRRGEMAVRVALGASGRRVVQQLLTESVLLAVVGGIAAVALSVWLSALIGGLEPPLPINLGLDIAPDWRVLVFTLTVAVSTGIAFGLLPALRASRPDLVPALKDTGESGRRRGRALELRDVLVVGQMALSVLLLVGGALLVRSLGAAQRVDFGYDVDRISYLGLAMEMNGYDAEEAGVFYELARARLEAMPEVQAAGLASRVPLELNYNGFGIFIDGHQTSEDDGPYRMNGASVDERYFDVLGLEIVEGRGIEAADREEGHRVAVVTRAMAERYWPGVSAVGREFRRSWGGEPTRIVGVVEDYKVDTPGEAPKPYLHVPLRARVSSASFVVRTSQSAAATLPALEAGLRTLDPDLMFLETAGLRRLADVRLFPIRAGAWLFGAFGVLALVLAAVGLYGVIGYAVSRRVREIGVRKALGAENGQILGLVMRRGMLLVLVGGVMGAALSGLGAQLLGSVLFVGAFDAVSFGLALAVLASVTALANWVPASRAASVDPMRVLRGE
jgi:predicted permease